MIRLGGPVLGGEELEAIRTVLSSGQLVQAEQVQAFEEALSLHLGLPVIVVSSGTAALHLALLASGVRAGDLVVVPTFSWPATANVVEALGAQAVFVDIREDDFNLDVNALAATLHRLTRLDETRRRLKAVIAVHAFGAIGDMDTVAELCTRHGVRLVEDAACALGSTLGGRQPGSWGDVACFSFHPRKLLTTAEGGAVACAGPEVQASIRMLRNHGMVSVPDGLEFVAPGLNYRMSEVHAAIGRCQLRRLDSLVSQRRRQATHYGERLTRHGVFPQRPRADCSHNVQSYVVRIPVAGTERRKEVVDGMRKRGFETTIGTWHIPLTSYYRHRYGYAAGDFPVTDRVFATTMTLPLSSVLTEDDQDDVVAALAECLA